MAECIVVVKTIVFSFWNSSQSQSTSAIFNFISFLHTKITSHTRTHLHFTDNTFHPSVRLDNKTETEQSARLWSRVQCDFILWLPTAEQSHLHTNRDTRHTNTNTFAFTSDSFLFICRPTIYCTSFSEYKQCDEEKIWFLSICTAYEIWSFCGFESRKKRQNGEENSQNQHISGGFDYYIYSQTRTHQRRIMQKKISLQRIFFNQSRMNVRHWLRFGRQISATASVVWTPKLKTESDW